MGNYLSGALSLQMVPDGANINARRVSLSTWLEGIRPSGWVRDGNGETRQGYRQLPFTSCVGHEGTAKYLSRYLEGDLLNRQAVTLLPGDIVYVAQPVSGRLAVGQELSEPDLAFFICQIRSLLDADEAFDWLRNEQRERAENY